MVEIKIKGGPLVLVGMKNWKLRLMLFSMKALAAAVGLQITTVHEEEAPPAPPADTQS